MLSSQKLSAVVVPSSNPSSSAPLPAPSNGWLPPSSDTPSASARRSFFSDLCGIDTPSSRYTITKFRDYDHYCGSTSVWRHVAVIIFTPIPSIAISLTPPLITLQDPSQGALHNTGFMIHCFVTMAIIMYGSVLQVHAPLRLSMKEMPILRGLLVAFVGSAQLTAVVTLVGYLWRFPVPFVWINAYPLYLVLFIWSQFLVLQPTMGRNGNLKQHLVAFIPSYTAQATQVVVYPVFSVLFEISSEAMQIILTLAFPAIKFVFRRIVYIVTRRFPNDAKAEAVSGVEICSVMYQTMIMQSAPSPITTAILMGIDIVQGLFSVYVLMKKPCSIPQREVISRARQILCVERPALTDDDLLSFGTVRRLPRLHTWPYRNALSAKSQKPTVVVQTLVVKPRQLRRSSSSARSTKAAVTHALEAIQAAESTALLEYFEVVIPIASSVYIAWASCFRSAIYNPKIWPYHESTDQLSSALSSLVVYTLLQATSIVFLQAILWHRYRVSAMTLLAFALERHLWSLQGKLITWPTLNFQFPVVHYGVDFSFKFDFRPPPPANDPHV